ncbi:MAG: hypothetical protein ABF289_19315 [Clostridiales bacterium]
MNIVFLILNLIIWITVFVSFKRLIKLYIDYKKSSDTFENIIEKIEIPNNRKLSKWLLILCLICFVLYIPNTFINYLADKNINAIFYDFIFIGITFVIVSIHLRLYLFRYIYINDEAFVANTYPSYIKFSDVKSFKKVGRTLLSLNLDNSIDEISIVIYRPKNLKRFFDILTKKIPQGEAKK